MSRRRKTHIKYSAFTLVPVLLVVMAIFASSQASALSSGEWETVRSSIDSYVTSQYVATDDGEAGFVMTADTLKPLIDSNGDNTYLGEGDDAANAPVLLDVLGGQTTMIPATSLRALTSSSQNPVDATFAPLSLAKVNQHRNAGFSTTIVDYCATGHSQDRTTMAYGAMSAAGYFGAGDSGAAFPKVLGLKWGRQGWNYSTPGTDAGPYPSTAGGNLGLGAAASAPTPGTPSNANCTGSTPTSELVRCTAAAAMNATGAGAEPNAFGSSLGVDLRPSVPSNGYLGSGKSVSKPLNTLFATGGGLSALPTGTQLWFYNRTPHTGGMAAEGANMLGYTAVFQRWGLPYWDSSAPAEKLGDGAPWASQDPTAPDYYTILTVGGTYTSGPDTTTPTINSGPTASNITSTSASIERTTSEPATSKIHLVGSDSQVVDVNDTVLNATKSVAAGNATAISGLHEYVTYSGALAVYDGNANGASTALNFTTADVTNPNVAITAPVGTINTSSTTITATYSDSGSGINSASAVVYLDSSPVSGCTADGSGVSCTVTGLGITPNPHTIDVFVSDNDGNSNSDSSTFIVADATAPTVSNIAPDGIIINYNNPTITGDYYEPAPSSGIASIEAYISNTGGGIVITCNDTVADFNCPYPAGPVLDEGSHTVDVTVTDNATGSGTASGTFTVNTSLAAPVITGISPSGYINTTAADVHAYFTDTDSAINAAAVSVYWHDPDQVLTGCVVTTGGGPGAYTGSVNCDRSGLPQGSHVIDVSVTDMNGITTTGSATVFIDTVGPRAKSMQPRYNLATDSATITATLADDLAAGDYYWPPGSDAGVDFGQPVTVTLDGTTVTGCSVNTGTGALACPAQTGLGQGPHWTSITLTDLAGNTDTSGRGFAVDTIAPEVTGLSPSGTDTITSSSVIVYGAYSDSGTGINTATAGVYMDGSTTTLPGCTVTATKITCTATGLLAGDHTYSVKVADWARGSNRTGPGNIGSADGSFTVTPPTLIGSYEMGGVFFIEDGIRRGIASPAVFDNWGFSWDNVTWTPLAEVNAYPQGDNLTLLASHAGGVYLVQNNTFRPIFDGSTFNIFKDNWGLGWGDIKPISDSVFGSRSQGALITFPKLVTYSYGGTVYCMDTDGKRPIQNAPTFEHWGFNWGDIFYTRNNAFLAWYPSPNPLSVLASNNGGVFLISNGTKNPIDSAESFNNHASFDPVYNWNNIFPVSDELLNTLGPGTTIY
jgi:hypothetical protein